MRRAALLGLSFAVCAAAACGSRPDPPGEEPVIPRGRDASAVAACRLSDRQPSPREDLGAPIAVARGPRGVRVFARSGFWDESGAIGEPGYEPGTAVAWAGDGYLIATARGLARLDRDGGSRRALRALPSRACDVHLLELPGAVAMLYRRAARCDGEGAAGPVFFQRLTLAGAPEAPPVQLGVGDADSARAQVVTLRARVDAGRVIVRTVEASGDSVDIVLGADGRELAEVQGGGVTCTRAGCVRLLGSEAPGAGPDRLLHAEIVGRGGGFALPLSARDVVDAAAQGDRVLVRFVTDGAAGPQPEWMNFAVVDLVRRQVVPVFDPGSRGPVTTWYEAANASDAVLSTTPRGFVIIATDATGRLFRREITCAR